MENTEPPSMEGLETFVAVRNLPHLVFCDNFLVAGLKSIVLCYN